MTANQIERIKQSIKLHRAALAAEKRRFGWFDDSPGRRYGIAELYMRIADYKGAITYKRWFNKNFPDDIGGTAMSLYWSIAFHALGKIAEAERYTIDTALQNNYLHQMLLGREVVRIDMYEHGHHDLIGFTRSILDNCKKVTTKPYLEFLSSFIETETYNTPVNRFIALSKLLKDEQDIDKRHELLNDIRDLMEANISGKK